jgi:imidazolonepropionase-like amidohydrolase
MRITARALPAILVPVLLLGGAAEPARAPERPRDLVVSAGYVFDGEKMLRNAAVRIRGTRITAVGPIARVARKPARRIRLRNATLLPGFIDLHVHVPPSFRGTQETILRRGVTTIRDLGTPEAALPAPRYRPGRIRAVYAGPLITAPGGYPIPAHLPDFAGVVRNAEEGRALVRTLVAKGARVIKIALEPGPGDWPMLSLEEVRAIVDEAHRSGRIVTAHVSEQRGLRLALTGGVDELAHMPCRGVTADAMRELAERRIPVVGTLHVQNYCPRRSSAGERSCARAVACSTARISGTRAYPSGSTARSSACSSKPD